MCILQRELTHAWEWAKSNEKRVIIASILFLGYTKANKITFLQKKKLKKSLNKYTLNKIKYNFDYK